MDQIKTGKFLAQIRKERQLTQRQLADMLSISDKTVSKWECGKGMPEVSLMLPLCNELHITVNELLSGERVPLADYQTRAEENMMDLIKQNAENKKHMGLSMVCAAITVIAVCSLVVIASYLALPVTVRIALIVFAIVTAAAGITAAAMLEIKAGYYECPHCHTFFVPSMGDYVKAYHTFTKRRLTCPSCGRIAMCRHRLTRK